MDGMKKVEVLRAACCIAGIDGQTTDPERRILKMLADEVGVGEASLSAMIERAEKDKEFHREQFRVLKADPKESMQLLFGVALADGKLLDDERELLERFAERLEVSSDQFDQWYTQAIDYLMAQRQAST